jgi:hypothetical protein
MSVKRKILIVGESMTFFTLWGGVAADFVKVKMTLGYCVTYFAMLIIGCVLIGVSYFMPLETPVNLDQNPDDAPESN